MLLPNSRELVDDPSLVVRALIAFANVHMQFMVWVFLIGPMCIALIAVVNRRASPDGGKESDRWLWSVLCAALFVASGAITVLNFRRAGDVALLLNWTSMTAGAIALGEAFVAQQKRREANRSRWSPAFIVAVGLLSSLIHPIALAVVSSAPQVLSWRERRIRRPL